MLEKKYKDTYYKFFLQPVLNRCNPHIQANYITLLAGIFGLSVIPALFTHHTYWAVALLLISGYLDTLDGAVARLYNQSSQLGSALDIVVDRVVEWSVIFGLYLFDPQHVILCFVMLLANLVCICSFLVVGIFIQQATNKSFFYHSGIIERAEAFIFYILMILFPQYFDVLALSYIILVFITAIFHLRFRKL